MQGGGSYLTPLCVGQVMFGGALAEVVTSRASNLAPGDLVFAFMGWQEYAVLPGKEVSKLPRLEPETHLLSVFGIAGLTAYFGLLECGQPKAGETVVVSAAAGAVGSIVGQIAKLKGCHVVGIAGGPAKGEWLTRELRLDAAVDYKSPDFIPRLAEAVPNGIDLYFDNVGGDVFEACLSAMNRQGRIVCCGSVSQYDGELPRSGPRGVPRLFVTKQLTMRGFVVFAFDDRRNEALAELKAWVDAGKIKVHEKVIDGLENLPEAFVGVLHGENRGKWMVRV